MNYLAHAVLSGSDPLWQLGGYLGDHVRGDRWRDYPRSVGLGIVLHRRIDSYADRHPASADSRSRIGPDYRRYAGIMLDVFNDHFLARRFGELTDLDPDEFARHCDRLLQQHAEMLPPGLRRFARFQLRTNALRSYARRPFLDQVFSGLAGRLTRPGPLCTAGLELDRLYPSLEANFLQLYPDLVQFARNTRRMLADQSRSI